ncbi:MAG: ECF transporter S component [Ruminococcaceae bacterium]|nr:ECF transporter S component [Oscillospiraceae bacterium]
MNKGVKFITYTAALLSMLIVAQFFSKPLGQLVTGALVNFILISACLVVNVEAGLVVAIVSPFLASMLGIGPKLIELVAAIAVGNSVLVLTYYIIFRWIKRNSVSYPMAIAYGAILKFAALYFGVVKFLLPFLNVGEAAMKAYGATFGITQLFTAFLGGIIAWIIVPTVKRAVKF